MYKTIHRTLAEPEKRTVLAGKIARSMQQVMPDHTDSELRTAEVVRGARHREIHVLCVA